MQIRPATADDRPTWERLYRGYADFYETPTDLDEAWALLESGEVECLLAEVDGEVVALAHLTTFPRVLDGGTGGYLQDLYVDQAARGGGVADAMLAHIKQLATERGWSIVRWITTEDNQRAQTVYDRNAVRTTWVTYDMRP